MKYVFAIISTFIHLPVMFVSAEILLNNIFVFFWSEVDMVLQLVTSGPGMFMPQDVL